MRVVRGLKGMILVPGADGGEEEEEKTYFEMRNTAFGEMTSFRHSASAEDYEPRWE
jgi:hypothetical protein